MAEGSHRFTVGDYECVALSDGSVDYAPERFYANAAPADVEEALRSRGLPTEHVTTPYSYLFVNTGTNQVLVDMGAGNLAPSTGRLLTHMADAGLQPQQIDTVVITHAHPDHVGGTLDDEGEPVFENAKYFMWQREWDFWFSNEAGEMAPPSHVQIARRSLEPIAEQVQFVNDEAEFLPGFRAVQAPGHTPGHLAVLITSGQERVFYISDTVLSPLHLEHPDWLPVYDILPDEAAQSKQRVFDLAAEQDLLVMGMHFPPFPSLGRVSKRGEGWLWKPSEGKQ